MADFRSLTPAGLIAAECARRGTGNLIAGCVLLLRGEHDAVDDALIVALAGQAAGPVLDGRAGGRGGYWPRVWGARGLLHALDGPPDGPPDERVTTALIDATADEAWRVREMTAKVIARHKFGDALDAVAALRDDPVPRVRAAAHRAVTLLAAAGA